jgi:hypothetical protein
MADPHRRLSCIGVEEQIRRSVPRPMKGSTFKWQEGQIRNPDIVSKTERRTRNSLYGAASAAPFSRFERLTS